MTLHRGPAEIRSFGKRADLFDFVGVGIGKVLLAVLQLQPLNADTSWWMSWGQTSFVVDPWLVGSQIDGFAWFNKQFHGGDPVAVDHVPDHDWILISQRFSDHCHLETLSALPNKSGLLAVPGATRQLRKQTRSRFVQRIGSQRTGWTRFGTLRVLRLTPSFSLSARFNALVIANDDNDAVFYSPHGYSLTSSDIEIVRELNVELLITSCSSYRLPRALGGSVNPGLENTRLLDKALSPHNIVSTHDEQKNATGLVSRLARRTYPSIEEVSAEFTSFVPRRKYSALEFA